MANTQQLGQQAEAAARHYLETQGLRFITQNFRCRLGEIDIIMRHAETLVFVEVRFRNSLAFGGPAASITHSKQRRILAAAETYLQQNPKQQLQAMRIDVVTLLKTGKNTKIDWLQNAISAE